MSAAALSNNRSACGPKCSCTALFDSPRCHLAKLPSSTMAPFQRENTWYQSMLETSRPDRSAYRATIASADGSWSSAKVCGPEVPSGIVPPTGWKMSAQARSISGSPIVPISQSTTASRRGGASVA
ncbi:unannotated protein [freshwater metagenome]|uniref:Unannotated protein n=1 Tax=freshwater metagenome TaxID=449393 RepID=A0A6J6SD86_9ZZZZ